MSDDARATPSGSLLKTLLARGDLTPAVVLTGLGSIREAMAIVHDLRDVAFEHGDVHELAEGLATVLDHEQPRGDDRPQDLRGSSSRSR